MVLDRFRVSIYEPHHSRAMTSDYVRLRVADLDSLDEADGRHGLSGLVLEG